MPGLGFEVESLKAMTGKRLWLHGLRVTSIDEVQEVDDPDGYRDRAASKISKGLLALDGACAGLRLLEDDHVFSEFAS